MGAIGSHLDLTSGRLGYQAQSAAGVCGQEKERQSECPESHSRQWCLIPPYYWEGWRLISPKACCRVEKYVVRWKTGGPLLSLEMPKRDHGLGGLCTSHIVWDASEAGIQPDCAGGRLDFAAGDQSADGTGILRQRSDRRSQQRPVPDREGKQRGWRRDNSVAL
jgi:hypothetical protein